MFLDDDSVLEFIVVTFCAVLSNESCVVVGIKICVNERVSFSRRLYVIRSQNCLKIAKSHEKVPCLSNMGYVM